MAEPARMTAPRGFRLLRCPRPRRIARAQCRAANTCAMWNSNGHWVIGWPLPTPCDWHRHVTEAPK